MTPDEQAVYGNVMRGVYRFSNAMLGRLLELAGPETTVVVASGHGFHSEHVRPSSSSPARAEVSWHRDQGFGFVKSWMPS